ncbi:MAG: hypothetical protein HYV99_02405 [Betaproteobacteria bacterium]|nr:hypothetical protein [Betaproteobacteria bacterium]
MDRIAIPHRFTGGGVPVVALYSERAMRVSLRPVPAETYATHARASRRQRLSPPHRDGPHDAAEWNRFGLDGGAMILFRMMMHRPMPPEGIVKQVTWLGQRHVTRGWQWALAITVEESPRPAGATAGTFKKAGACGLDVGWRVMGDGAYLRIGYLVDEVGDRIELRLPLDAPTSHTRHLITMAARAGKSRRPLTSWRDMARLDEGRGRYIEATKAAVRPLVEASAVSEARAMLRAWDRVREGGLVRLLRAVSAEPADRKLADELRVWHNENDHARAVRMVLWDRLIGRRRWYYENIAAWLCAQWNPIVVEDLGLKAMAEEDDKAPALDASMRYRQIAALSGAHPIRKALIKKPAAYTTLTCARCRDVLPSQDGSLWLECGNGHRWDQDENAARVLLSQIAGAGSRADASRNESADAGRKVHDIPDRLRAVAVRVHLG